MNTNEPRRILGWPLAFFLLNVAAIVVWFAVHGEYGDRELIVTAVSPGGTDIAPGDVTEIRLDFNLPLDPATVRPDSLRLVPAVTGSAELAGERSLRFQIREALRPATKYALVLSPGLRGARGQPPAGELLELATRRFRLEEVNQVAFDRDSFTVELVFNQPIAASDLDKAISLRTTLYEDQSRAAGMVKVLGNANQRRQRLRVNETRTSFLRVALPAGLTGSSGPLGLAQEEVLLFRIVGSAELAKGARPEWAEGLEETELRPEIAFLGMTAEWDDGRGVVRVRTTTPLDTTRARGYVTVEPSLPVTFASAWNGFKILGDFEPGKQYRVTLAAGMPAGYAGDLPKTISRQVWFDDLPPSLAFTHGGGFLSPDGLLKLAVKSRNVETFNLGVRRLYESNIVEALLREYDAELSPELVAPEKTRKIAASLPVRNKEQETLIDLRDVLDDGVVGVYGLEIWRDDSRWSSRNTLIAVSDLGLASRLGRDRLLAWTTSIRRGTPRPGTKVSVYSNRRQLLASGETDADGLVNLELPPLPDGEKAALVLGETEGGEFSFVRLDRDMRPRSGESRSGRDYAAAYEAFLAPERGVYRGGETVLLSGLVKDREVDEARDLPVELRLLGPDRRELATVPAVADGAGRLNAAVRLGEGYAGGSYLVQARIPGQKDVIGSTEFRIADYMPETLSVAVNFDEKPKRDDRDRDNRVVIRVSRLAGGDIGSLPVEIIGVYRPLPFAPDGWDGWAFGDSRAGRSAVRLERTAYLDGDGTAAAAWNNPSLEFPAAASLTVRTEVSETGRASSAETERVVHPVPFYVGADAAKRVASAGEVFILPLAAVAPDGTLFRPVDGWTAELLRVEYKGVMKLGGSGRLVYEWVRREIPEARLSGEWRDGRSEALLTPKTGGGYRLVVSSAGGRACVLDFTADGEGATWHGEDPETLTLALDRERYGVGETAVAVTAAPFAGQALICVETDRVLAHWLREFKEGENTIEIPVTDAMRPNAFVTVTLVRPALAEEEWRPHRLSGVGSIRVDNADRRLAVAIDAPESLAPGAPAKVAITVERGGEPAAGAAVTLWAVDAGVLSLTGYRLPSPWERFYQNRRIGVSEADMFSRLAPELSAWLAGEAAPGGGDGSGELGRRFNPIFASRVKAAVLYDGELVADDNGVATATFDIPEFAGRLRFMCWASADRDLGAAEKEIEVRAPVSVAASWPRFAAPGDEFEVAALVINRSGKTGVAKIRCETDDMLTVVPASAAVELNDNESRRVVFRVAAARAGLARATVVAELDGARFGEDVEISVRPPVLFSREAGTRVLRPGEKDAFVLGSGLLAENSRIRLLAGGGPIVSLSGSMNYLLDYPYGCAEQTAARLMALVFLPDLLALNRPSQFASGDLSLLATACSERLLSMQNANGSLRMWPSGGEELFWVSAQALFVLAESRAAGHTPPQSLVDNLARYLDDRLDDRLRDSLLDEDDGESAALACLALAKVDRVKRSWLLRLEEIAAARAGVNRGLSSAALAFLCEAVAAAGDREAGGRLYRRFNPSGDEAGVSRNRVVELAAWLAAAMATADAPAEADLFAVELAERVREGYTDWSTRENSFVLAALGRYWRKAGVQPEGRATLLADGVAREFSTRRGGSWDTLKAGTRVEVENKGEGSLRLFWMAEGVPLSGKAREEDRGLTARRRVYAASGEEIAVPYSLRAGEVYEIRLQVTGRAPDLVLADLLPAGLEIEDATLKGRPLGKDAAKGMAVRHVERKDDRLLVFASLDGTGEYRYLARAVTAGRFVWPALDASRMYDASVRSVHGRGEATVSGGKEAANDS